MMAKSTADEHYEEKFEFPMWKLIKQRAEEKDISYIKAAVEVLPEYQKSIRYRDTEYEMSLVNARNAELSELAEKEEPELAKGIRWH